VDDAHLPGYLNEFTFRFNRRRSRSRGLLFYRVLELAAGHDPVRYRDLIASQPRLRAPSAPPSARGRPPSMERPPAGRPGERMTRTPPVKWIARTSDMSDMTQSLGGGGRVLPGHSDVVIDSR
jgi:hypothetical protein